MAVRRRRKIHLVRRARQGKREGEPAADIEQFIQDNHIRYVIWTSDLQTPPPAALGPPGYDTPDFKVWRLS